MAATVAIGTDKGLFIASASNGGASDAGWQVAEPQFLGWQVTALGRTTAGTYLVGTGSAWYGPAIHRSSDLKNWIQVIDGPTDPGDRKLEQIWRFHQAPDAIYVGVAEAGLFRSVDDGVSWSPVDGLNNHPTSDRWQPGAGGMCAHAIVHHPTNPDRLWCGISAVGVLRTDDGGESWALCDNGVAITAQDEHGDIGFCVHALAIDPEDPDRLYRQDHQGIYRTDDGGDTWIDAGVGVPARFGFPIVLDESTRRLFVVPQLSDEQRIPVDGRLRVYRSDDGAHSWHDSSVGIPEIPGYSGVLRTAMATDEAGTVAFGTTGGDVFVSTDGGDSWQQIPVSLPRIFTVELFDS